MLEARSLSISFGGIAAVRDVSLSVAAGELLGLIGPNGAGKTTLLRLLTGALQPQAGSVHFEGRDVTRMPIHERARRGFVLTHQVVRPLRNLSLTDNVMLAAGHELTRHPWRALWHTQTATARARALAELARVGIADAADKPASAVPLGYLKRLQVAMVLALDPRLVLLDEPLAGLNSAEAQRFADLLVELNRKGLTLVLVEHNLGEVTRVASRLMVLVNGAVMAQGTAADVMARGDVQRAYLGATTDA
jgi:branched-chain amino acid transport system ATP-binding protein